MNRGAWRLALLAAVPAALAAQDTAPGAADRGTLGIAHVGAVVLTGGWATMQYGFRAGALGTTVDFGSVRTRRLRLLADVAYLRTAPRTERVETEGRSYRDTFRDLAGHLALAFHPRAPGARVAPFAAFGLGVHVLSSSFGSLTIDRRYNTNNVGALAALGTRVRLGGRGDHGVQLEVRGVQARDIRHASMHAGYAWFFNDLRR